MNRGMSLAAVLLSVGAGLEAQTSLTIYSDGRVLERRVLPLAVPAGRSIQRVGIGPLDLGSLFALDSGVVIGGVTYDGAVDQAAALKRAIGRKLSFAIRSSTEPGRTVEAAVLGTDPERYQLADGNVVFERPGIPLFPAELVTGRPGLELQVESDRARPGLGLGFFSGGASWQASYRVALGGAGGARITGAAVVQSATLRADSAQVQLVAGNIGRAVAKEAMDRPTSRTMAMAAPAPAAEEGVGETHLYTLPGRLTLLPGVETTAPLFDPSAAPIERTFTVRGSIPYWGGLQQAGDETVEPVSVTYIVKRTLKSPFGSRPLPGGIARIYQPDAEGRPQLIGESSLGHTAAGQDLRLDAGTAFDLTARRIQTDYATERVKNRTTATAGYSVAIANAKDSAVTVDVLEQRGGEWSVVTSSVAAEKLSSTTTRFRVRVPAKGEASLTYRVRVVW